MSSNPVTITKRDQEQILIRADFADKKTAAAIKKGGFAIPAQRRKEGGAMWLSPDELLIFTENAESTIAKIKPGLPPKHLIHDISGARVVFTLKGDHLRDVLAKGAPRDMQIAEIGEVIRTRLGQVAVAFWLNSENEAELVCFRSVADHVEEFLHMASKADGLPVLG